jgi:hypothetical protein
MMSVEMRMAPEKKWYDDIDARWSRMDELVELFGTEDDKIAWMLCRGDAGEWRMAHIVKGMKKKIADAKRKHPK